MKFIITALLCLSTFFAEAHNIEKLCWNNGKYSFRATSIPYGNAVVKVYSNSNYTGLIQTFNVNVNASSEVYWVNQPVRTTKVYVKVTWSDNYVNQDASGTNQCVLTPITFGNIDARNEGNNTIITFNAESTDRDNSFTVNYHMADGGKRTHGILFWQPLEMKDTWIITINNITNVYTIRKR